MYLSLARRRARRDQQKANTRSPPASRPPRRHSRCAHSHFAPERSVGGGGHRRAAAASRDMERWRGHPSSLSRSPVRWRRRVEIGQGMIDAGLQGVSYASLDTPWRESARQGSRPQLTAEPVKSLWHAGNCTEPATSRKGVASAPSCIVPIRVAVSDAPWRPTARSMHQTMAGAPGRAPPTAKGISPWQKA